MSSMDTRVTVHVLTEIKAIEARMIDTKDVLIIDNEAFFVLDALFVEDGIRISLEGHDHHVCGRNEPLLVVRTSLDAFKS